MIPAGDGVYRTIFRGPSLTNPNQNLFGTNKVGSYNENEKVTYCHPAELV